MQTHIDSKDIGVSRIFRFYRVAAITAFFEALTLICSDANLVRPSSKTTVDLSDVFSFGQLYAIVAVIAVLPCVSGFVAIFIDYFETSDIVVISVYTDLCDARRLFFICLFNHFLPVMVLQMTFVLPMQLVFLNVLFPSGKIVLFTRWLAS